MESNSIATVVALNALDRIKQLEAALREAVDRMQEAAGVLAEYIKVENNWPDVHPANERRFDRDMEQVSELEQAIANSNAVLNDKGDL